MSEKTAPQPDSGPSPIGEISQEPSAFEAFLDANQKKLVIIGILIILCLIGYVIYDGLGKLSAKNAAADVAAARGVPELDAVSKTHAGTNAGGSALILKAQSLWQDQQQQEAVDTLQSFVSDYSDHPALGSAYASLGSYHQQMGKLDEARTAYQSSTETNSAASSLALISLGDLARSAGDDEAAKGFYDRVAAEYEDSHFQSKLMARQRLELIGVNAPTEKVPEPPKPATPAPSVTTAPVTMPEKSVIEAENQPESSTTEPDQPSDSQETEELGDIPPLDLPEDQTPAEAPENTEAPKTPASE